MKSAVSFQSLSPNVIVENVNKAVEYYTSVLGFTFITSVPEKGTYNWAMVQHDGVAFMFQSLKSIQEDLPELNIATKGSSPGTSFIKLKGIDALYQSVKNKAEIVSDMRTTFYGMKEFTIKDLNGYFLTFAEEVN